MWGKAGFYTKSVSEVSLLVRNCETSRKWGKESGLTYGVYPAHGSCTPESLFKVNEIRGAAS